MMLKHLDLFSGVGGFSLGLENTGGFKTVAFCEIDPYCQKVLAKNWPEVPIYNDVANYQPTKDVDLVTAGFPCQDISHAGKCAGISGERSGLFWHVIRTICLVGRPKLLLENVAALLGRGMGEALGALATIGYDTEWHCIQPKDIGIPAIRDRVWIYSHAAEKHVAEMVDPGRLSLELRRVGAAGLSRVEWTMDKRRMGRGVDGIPDATHRFEQLGNAVVPQIPEMIGRAILSVEDA